MNKPRLLDLFCGAGGAAMGYSRAGFEVVGVDLHPQKRYPFEFHQGDALEFLAEHGGPFDAIHASPPCQAHSCLRHMPNTRKDHPHMIEPTRAALLAIARPYVIENVVGAPLIDPLLLCGTMFGLVMGDGELRRHRLFESSIPLCTPGCCQHTASRTIGVYGNSGGRRRYTVVITGHSGEHSNRDWTPRVSVTQAREAMGIDWMTFAELAQAIPPAYTEFIGRQLLDHVYHDCRTPYGAHVVEMQLRMTPEGREGWIQ
jgi:DNA (cytosine-5)-methyltransferase 1